MNHSEFKKRLSGRLDIGESEVSRLLRANRKILKKLVKKDNGFAIPRLGQFKKHPVFKHKEYSHYHGYKLLTRLKKILRFYPELPATNKKFPAQPVTESEISHLLTNSTGISDELSELFINETAAIIKEGLARDRQVFISGVGLFKSSPRDGNDNVRAINLPDTLVYFRADAGLRSNILKSGEPLHRQPDTGFLSTQRPVGKATDDRLSEFKKIRQSCTAMNTTLSSLSETHASATPPADSKKSATVIPLNTTSGTNDSGRAQSRKASYLNAGSNNPTTLSRKTFQMEENEQSHNEKHPYFEWVVISLFLIILAAGLYLIKPSADPQDGFKTQPFEFTDAPENKTAKSPEAVPEKIADSKPLPVQPQAAETATEKTAEQSIPSPQPVPPPSIVQYQTVSGDSLWKIATNYYSDPYFWPVIYQLNADKLASPDILEVGITLDLPPFNTLFNTLSPEEKPMVTESYYEVYRAYKDLGKADAETYLSVSQNF